MSANNVNPNNNYQPKHKQSNRPDDKKGKKEVAILFDAKDLKPKVNKEIQRYAQRLIDPLDCELGLSPSPVPNRMVAIRDKIVIDLKTHLSDTGDWFVEVRPTLNDTVTLTKGSTKSVANNSNLMVTGAAFINNKMSGGLMTYGDVARTNIDFTAKADALLGGGFGVGDTGGAKVYGVTWSPLQFTGDVSGVFAIYTANNLDSLGVAAAIYSTTVTQATTGVLPGTLSLPANTVWVGFSFTTSQSSTIVANFGLLYNSGAGSQEVPNQLTHMTTVDTEFSGNLIDYDRYRVTAQDLLITYMGSDFANGGVIASARVPDTWSPSENHYDAITQLPYDSYNGPLKVGTHVHWVPATLEELVPVPFGELPRFSNKLIAYGRQDNLVDKQSVRLMVTTIIEFYSDVPIYGAMKYCPPPTNLGLLIYWMGVNIPAATSNEDHFQKLKKFVTSAINKGIQYGIDNPDVIAKLLRTAIGMIK